MRKQRRLSLQAADVLDLFVRSPERELWGRKVIEETGIPSGSLYPILHLLVDRRLLMADWEPLQTAVESGRRPRRLYRLNPDLAARVVARDAIAEARGKQGRVRINLAPRPTPS